MESCETKDLSKTRVIRGTDINTQRYTFRSVWSQDCFVIQIGPVTQLKISWEMLRECFEALDANEGSSIHLFKARALACNVANIVEVGEQWACAH
jgi:hypothetical protein